MISAWKELRWGEMVFISKEAHSSSKPEDGTRNTVLRRKVRSEGVTSSSQRQSHLALPYNWVHLQSLWESDPNYTFYKAIPQASLSWQGKPTQGQLSSWALVSTLPSNTESICLRTHIWTLAGNFIKAVRLVCTGRPQEPGNAAFQLDSWQSMPCLLVGE